MDLRYAEFVPDSLCEHYNSIECEEIGISMEWIGSSNTRRSFNYFLPETFPLLQSDQKLFLPVGRISNVNFELNNLDETIPLNDSTEKIDSYNVSMKFEPTQIRKRRVKKNGSSAEFVSMKLSTLNTEHFHAIPNELSNKGTRTNVRLNSNCKQVFIRNGKKAGSDAMIAQAVIPSAAVHKSTYNNLSASKLPQNSVLSTLTRPQLCGKENFPVPVPAIVGKFGSSNCATVACSIIRSINCDTLDSTSQPEIFKRTLPTAAAQICQQLSTPKNNHISPVDQENLKVLSRFDLSSYSKHAQQKNVMQECGCGLEVGRSEENKENDSVTKKEDHPQVDCVKTSRTFGTENVQVLNCDYNRPIQDFLCHTVRKKCDRERLQGYSCACCRPYYAALNLNEEECAKRINQISRHRDACERPSTPEHFWEVGMANKNEQHERGQIRETTSPINMQTRNPVYRKGFTYSSS